MESHAHTSLTLHSKGLVKRYRKRIVVDDVSINVNQGEIVGLLGPNGAGKTTTFYMMVGLVTPNDGDIYLNETRLTGMPMYKRARLGVGYLAQEASVFRNLTVRQNLESILQFLSVRLLHYQHYVALVFYQENRHTFLDVVYPILLFLFLRFPFFFLPVP